MLPPATITDRDSLSASSPHHARTRRSALLYSRKLALLTLAFAFVLSFSLPTEAATITVSGTCSLPDAIVSANTDTATGGCPAGSGRDTIQLSGTITLSASLPVITAPIDIIGPAGGYATIDGQGTYQMFIINDGVNPRLSRLILENGRTQTSFSAALLIVGGGTLSDMQFRNNVSFGSEGYGGAIQHVAGSGTLNIIDSSFTSNYGVDGGAVSSQGGLFGRNLIFRNNEAVIGGALRISPFRGMTATATLNQVTFQNNRVSGNVGNGGAIHVFGAAQLTVNGATFEGNTSESGGSAVYVGMSGNVNLNMVRFRNNTGGEAVVYRQSDAGSVTINCLLELSGNNPNVISDSVTITNNNCSGNGGSQSEPAPERDSGTVNQETIAHNQAVIDEHGYAVTVPHGLGTIAFKALNPKDCGTIGNQAVCDMDVLQVADVSGWAEQGIRFCFKGYGQVLFVPSHDADRQPIDQKTAQPETLPVEVDGEHVCVTINRDGKLFLIDAAPLVTRTQAVSPVPYSPTGSGPAPETDCDLPPRLQVGDRAFRDGYDPSNLRSDAARTGQDIGDIRRGVVVTVIEGPVNRDNYNWYKVNRDGGGSGWIAESGDTDNGCGYFFEKVAAEEAATSQEVEVIEENEEHLGDEELSQFELYRMDRMTLPDEVFPKPSFSEIMSQLCDIAIGRAGSANTAKELIEQLPHVTLNTLIDMQGILYDGILELHDQYDAEIEAELVDHVTAGTLFEVPLTEGVCGGLKFALNELAATGKGLPIGYSIWKPVYDAQGIAFLGATEAHIPLTNCSLKPKGYVGVRDWPDADRRPVGSIGPLVDVPAFGKITLGGKEYYIVRGKIDKRNLIELAADAFTGRSLPIGTGYIAVDQVTPSEGCVGLVDWNSVGLDAYLAPGKSDRNALGPAIFNAQHTEANDQIAPGIELDCGKKVLSAEIVTVTLCKDMFYRDCFTSRGQTPKAEVLSFTDDGRVYVRLEFTGLLTSDRGWMPALHYGVESGSISFHRDTGVVQGSALDSFEQCLPKF